MMFVLSLLLLALVGQGASQTPAPSATSTATPCYARCFSQFMVDQANSCKTKCVCAGSKSLLDFDCCMAGCPADQQSTVTPFLQNSCDDGKSIALKFTCGANRTTSTSAVFLMSNPTALVTSLILVTAQTTQQSTPTSTSGADSSASNAGSGGTPPAVSLGVGLGVGLPLAALVVGGLALLWRRSRRKADTKGCISGSEGGVPDGLGRTFVFPSTMVLPTPEMSVKDFMWDPMVTPDDASAEYVQQQELSV
ncbi:uncharacterized protein CTRU02_205618 [Colletotrichum truncatum]|uniref:Uncharacterized protein n=1 Tax=Colletotrichum truncatum TaxID=5467 RepID=A0ACC3Z4I7_COLTU|nr:uncharacterized protein CTRU02_09371 [Colletotrichum truncatum]KAF6788563.1 hypothetical protein CTRU02_09371 [Colletotrichum truncatum]